MPSLVSIEEVTDLVASDLNSTQLQRVLDRVEAELSGRMGDVPDGVAAFTVTVTSEGSHVFLRWPIASVSNITENAPGATATAVAASSYLVDSGAGMIRRISGRWAELVTVTCVPRDQRDRRKAGIIELLRITLERTAMQAESVAGEYSYTAMNWDAAIAQIKRNLGYMEF